MLEGLRHMHEKGVMHRDLKPENLMLRNKRKVWDIFIIDFGLAQFTANHKMLFKRCGTPGFVAPEVINCTEE